MTAALAIDKLANLEAANKVPAKVGIAPEANKETPKTAEPIHKALHAKQETLPTKYIFKKIKADDSGLTSQVKGILDRFQINANATEYDCAVMSEDGNTLVIANRGQVGLKQLFGGTNSFTRALYKIFGWIPRMFGAAHKAIAANRYKELFTGADIEEQGEPLKHVLSALKSGEYHTVTVFHKDESTGEFTKNPVAVTITDAFDNLIDTHIRSTMQAKNLPEAEIANEIKLKKEKYGTFEKYYSADKVIPLTKSPKDLKDLLHQVTEGLYAAQGFDAFVIPSQVHPQTNVNSNDLNYLELDWHYIKQKADGKWKIVGNPKLLDSFKFKTAEDKESYLANMNPTEYSPKLTIVRPLAKASEPIPPFLSNLQQWSTMSQGSQLRTNNVEDHKLIEMTEPVNAMFIEKYDKALAA